MENKIKEILNKYNLKYNSNYNCDDIYKNGKHEITIYDEKGFKYSTTYESIVKNFKRGSKFDEISKYNKYINETTNIKILYNENIYYENWRNLRKAFKNNKNMYEYINREFKDIIWAKNIFIRNNLIPKFETYKNSNERLNCETKEGYKCLISVTKIQSGHYPRIVSKDNPYSIYII